ncbi:MAG: cold shock domain-containing protein [Geobacteraceae bacterium]|nr:cold shock domain-containing protein [Geobacteraceae bacterium]
MAQSTGTFLHEIKGFGFIEQENGDEAFTYFLASSAIGFKSLIEGDRVTFGTTKGPKKLQAGNVNKI